MAPSAVTIRAVTPVVPASMASTLMGLVWRAGADAGEGRANSPAVRKHPDLHRAREGVLMRVGVLTGGGDCPGLNAVIRAIVRTGALDHDFEFIGFRDGWRGPLEADVQPLDIQAVRGILPRGGTILGSSRTN